MWEGGSCRFKFPHSPIISLLSHINFCRNNVCRLPKEKHISCRLKEKVHKCWNGELFLSAYFFYREAINEMRGINAIWWSREHFSHAISESGYMNLWRGESRFIAPEMLDNNLRFRPRFAFRSIASLQQPENLHYRRENVSPSATASEIQYLRSLALEEEKKSIALQA